MVNNVHNFGLPIVDDSALHRLLLPMSDLKTSTTSEDFVYRSLTIIKIFAQGAQMQGCEEYFSLVVRFRLFCKKTRFRFGSVPLVCLEGIVTCSSD